MYFSNTHMDYMYFSKSIRFKIQIMDIYPEHACWTRNRPPHHSGAIRSYVRDAEGDDGYPRGPQASPRPCPSCEPCDSQYDSASPDREEWFLSNDDIFDNSQEDSRFDMKRKIVE